MSDEDPATTHSGVMNNHQNRESGTLYIPTWRAFDSYDDLRIGEWSSASYALLPEHLPVCDTDLKRVGRVWVDENSNELLSAISNTLTLLLRQGDSCARLLAEEVTDDVRLAFARLVLQDRARQEGLDEHHPSWPTPGYPRRRAA